MFGRGAHSELVHVGAAEKERSGGLQFFHYRRVIGRAIILQHFRGGARDFPFYQNIVLERERDAAEK